MRIELSKTLRDQNEPQRARWNPERATDNPAHLTLIDDGQLQRAGCLHVECILLANTATETLARFALTGGKSFTPR